VQTLTGSFFITFNIKSMKNYSLFFLLVSIAILACNNGNTDPSAGRKDSVAVSKNEQQQALELVFSDPTYQLTGVAKEPGGRLLVNYPRWSDIYAYAVIEASGDSTRTPFPDSVMNMWKPGQPGKNKWVCVQSVYVDDSSRIWILDPAAPKLKKIQGAGSKLVLVNKTTGRPEKTYSFMSILPDTAYVNDVRIDVARNFAYLTESKGGGIIVLDLGSGQMRRVLDKHPSTKSDPAYRFIIDGRELTKDGRPAKFNSDGIALTPDGNWLYYKPLTDNKLYRISTDYLRDWNLKDTGLYTKVEDLGHFTTTDGMIFDKNGNLYLGDLQNYRIVQIDLNHKMKTIVQDERLIWPDSYSIADGYLYISCSQIQKQPEYNEGVNKRTSPYTIYRMKLP
jgi:sugar lactone lactonase YvrE